MGASQLNGCWTDLSGRWGMSILDSVVGMAVGGGAGLVMQQSSVAPVLRSAAAVALGYLGSMFIMLPHVGFADG